MQYRPEAIYVFGSTPMIGPGDQDDHGLPAYQHRNWQEFGLVEKVYKVARNLMDWNIMHYHF